MGGDDDMQRAATKVEKNVREGKTKEGRKKGEGHDRDVWWRWSFC
jgi:hypothetical protein